MTNAHASRLEGALAALRAYKGPEATEALHTDITDLIADLLHLNALLGVYSAHDVTRMALMHYQTEEEEA